MRDTQVLPDPPARPASALPAPFACSWENDGDAAWVRLAGELDTNAAAHVRRTLHEAQEQARLVVADLREVAFADSSALHAFVDADARARRQGSRLVVLRGPPHVDRIFALTGVHDVVEVVDVDADAPADVALLGLTAGDREDRSADGDDHLPATG